MKLYAGVRHVGLIARLAAPLRDGESVLDEMAAFASAGPATPGTEQGRGASRLA